MVGLVCLTAPPYDALESAEKEAEIELFIEPLTGLAIPLPVQKINGRG